MKKLVKGKMKNKERKMCAGSYTYSRQIHILNVQSLQEALAKDSVTQVRGTA